MLRTGLQYLKFSVRPVDGGWAWSVRDPQGRERAAGMTRDRTMAAALVLREIARASTQTDEAGCCEAAAEDAARAA